MKCENCGSELREGAKFCSVCGKGIKSEENKITLNYEELYKFLVEKKIANYPMYKVIIYSLLVFILISCMMPFYSVTIFGITQSASYISGDGIIVLILQLLNCILIKFNKRLGSMIVSFFPLVTIIYDFINVQSNVSIGSFSIGAYLCLFFILINTIVNIMIYVLYKKEKI